MQRIGAVVLLWSLAASAQVFPHDEVASGQAPTAFSQYGGFAGSPGSINAMTAGRGGTGRATATPYYEYLIGSLDVLEIDVYDAPEFSIVQRVRPDGTIRIPLLRNLVTLQGLTPLEAEDQIAKALLAEEMMV